jgi:hypothetical protein
MEMKMTPQALSAAGPARYDVRFESADGEVQYTFTVDTAIVPVVTWEHDFWVAMEGDLDPAADLFQSILAFHNARRPAGD